MMMTMMMLLLLVMVVMITRRQASEQMREMERFCGACICISFMDIGHGLYGHPGILYAIRPVVRQQWRRAAPLEEHMHQLGTKDCVCQSNIREIAQLHHIVLELFLHRTAKCWQQKRYKCLIAHKKQATKLHNFITLPNICRFSKFYHWCAQQ